MIEFSAPIIKLDDAGHMTGWKCIHVTLDHAQQLLPGNRKSFRVRGKIDQQDIAGLALLPLGDGSFCLPLNISLRKKIGKSEGALVQVKLERDPDFQFKVPDYILDCLSDDPTAALFFEKLPPSQQKYFVKWIESAKTTATQTARILKTMQALAAGQNYVAMVRSAKSFKEHD